MILCGKPVQSGFFMLCPENYFLCMITLHQFDAFTYIRKNYSMKMFLFAFLFVAGCSLTGFSQKDSTHFDYLGKYNFPSGSVVPMVEVTGDSLTALTMYSEAGTSPMKYEGVDSFSIINFNGSAAFRRHDSSRQIIGIHIEAMGYVLDGEKVNGSTTWNWRVAIKDDKILTR